MEECLKMNRSTWGASNLIVRTPHPGRAFASRLHAEYLKPLGFKRLGATLLRGREDFVEMYNIQGSRWNTASGPWRFYVNVMVRFTDVGPLQGQKPTPTYFHAQGRSNSIIHGSQEHFEATEEDITTVAQDVARLLLRIGDVLVDMLPAAHERALAGFFSPLPVPDSWVSEIAD